ncbi:MAG: nuoL [Ilumatobacteraceae bacterium]|nr:nuoL [Ilumatobacteraceae bacterium]
MLDAVWLIPALPLAGFLIILVFGRRLGEPKAGYFATLMTASAFAVTVGVFFSLMSKTAEERHHLKTLFSWLPVGSLHVDVAFLVDPLSITMALFITGIGSLIHLYSIGYMHGDPKFSKFFLYLNLFVFSMLMLVLGSNLLVTFLGWEGVGTCSYLLISFWHTKDSNASAGKKAFVTNRVGDFGFMIAMFVAFKFIGSLDYSTINHAAQAKTISGTVATVIVLMLFVGACGKSAQLPLYIWLPDAMAGPTPVSALIHAATMVTSGVFLMTRISPMIGYATPWASTLIAIIGIATALFAATIAVAQNDIKKVLAYSTVSQLGYMFLAIGSHAYVAAIFHMVTHAFFKALLFLGSGSVIHGMHEEQDMRFMGALRKLMPITAATFIVGWLAIAGVPPFAGFWSKDEILLYAWDKSPILWALGLITALLTAYYMTRQVIMVFYGKARWNDERPHAEGEAAHDHGEIHPHESPWTMYTPLIVLAGLAIVGGGLNLPFNSSTKRLSSWLAPVVDVSERSLKHGTEDIKWVLAGIATLGALTGIALAYLVYSRHKIKAIEPTILANGWYYDRGITEFMGGPGRDGFEGVAWFDANVIDGAVNGTGKLVQGAAGIIRKGQSGLVRTYAALIGVGVVLLLAWFFIRGVAQ